MAIDPIANKILVWLTMTWAVQRADGSYHYQERPQSPRPVRRCCNRGKQSTNHCPRNQQNGRRSKMKPCDKNYLLRDDPEEHQGQCVIVADVRKTREELIQPYGVMVSGGYLQARLALAQLTIQNGLTQRHQGGAVRNQKCSRSETPRNHFISGQQPLDVLFRLASATTRCRSPVGIHNPQIVDVGSRFDDVQDGLRSSETVARVECWPAVDVVDRPVQRVRRPNGRMKFVPRHAMWAQEHIGRVPCDKRDGQN